MCNRMFGFSATSDGAAGNDDVHLALGYPQRTIFENVDDSVYNTSWGVYFQDIPSALAMDYVRRHPKHLHTYEKFQEDALAGMLPSFSWVEPSYIDTEHKAATDQHPNHDIGLGDQVVKQVYVFSLLPSPVGTLLISSCFSLSC